MGTTYLTPRAPVGLVRPSLVAAEWSQVQATGWTITNPATDTLRLAWGGGSAVDWTSTTETGLALVWPVKLGTLSNAARLCRAQLAYSHATANGIGIGIGFAKAAAVKGTWWVMRSEYRDGASTVHIRDVSDSFDAYAAATQTRRGIMSIELQALANANTWDKEPGVATAYANRAYTSANLWSASEGDDVYLVIYGVGDTTAGSVDITGLGLLFRRLETL